MRVEVRDLGLRLHAEFSVRLGNDVVVALVEVVSSSMSPTICSSTSSMVTSPDTPPILVDDDRDVVAVRAKVAQQDVEPLDSGTNTAGRSVSRR